jgi:nitroreductase
LGSEWINLQPTHFVVGTEPEVQAKLYHVCMKQRQILEAGATIVFTFPIVT